MIVCGLLFVREKGNELCKNGRVMKGLLFTCYHGYHSVQELLQSGLFVKQSTFNHLGEQCWHYTHTYTHIHTCTAGASVFCYCVALYQQSYYSLGRVSTWMGDCVQ